MSTAERTLREGAISEARATLEVAVAELNSLVTRLEQIANDLGAEGVSLPAQMRNIMQEHASRTGNAGARLSDAIYALSLANQAKR